MRRPRTARSSRSLSRGAADATKAARPHPLRRRSCRARSSKRGNKWNVFRVGATTFRVLRSLVSVPQAVDSYDDDTTNQNSLTLMPVMNGRARSESGGTGKNITIFLEFL